MKGLLLAVHPHGAERHRASKLSPKEHDTVSLTTHRIRTALSGLDPTSLNIYSTAKFPFHNYSYNWKIYIPFVSLVTLNVTESCASVISWIATSGIICHKMIYSKLRKKYEIISSKMLPQWMLLSKKKPFRHFYISLHLRITWSVKMLGYDTSHKNK